MDTLDVVFRKHHLLGRTGYGSIPLPSQYFFSYPQGHKVVAPGYGHCQLQMSFRARQNSRPSRTHGPFRNDGDLFFTIKLNSGYLVVLEVLRLQRQRGRLQRCDVGLFRALIRRAEN